MFIIWGFRSTGRVYTEGDALVSTAFFHVFFIPVFPLISIRVEKKGFIRDVGTELPFNGKSIAAGYLRPALFAVLCLGFAMTFDGLFFNSALERDKPELIAVGTGTFIIGSILWLWAMFALGAKRKTEAILESTWVRIAGGLWCVAAVLAIMFGTARSLPKEPTFESIAADQSLTDEETVAGLARLAFRKNGRVETSTIGGGIELDVLVIAGDQPESQALARQAPADAARIRKASAVGPLLMHVQYVIRHGRARHLSKVSVSLGKEVAVKSGQSLSMEIYRVVVPQDKFDAILQPRPVRETMFSADKILAEFGIVEIDKLDDF